MKVNFKAINFKEKSIGKIIKSSKIKYSWYFIINTKKCFLIFTTSKFTGKFTVYLNKKLLYRGNKTYEDNFKFTFKLEKITLDIVKKGYKYDLLI